MNTAVPIAITERDGSARGRQPVTVGVPLPRGLVRDPLSLALYGPDGRPEALQVATLSRWRDGSVKWALLDFQADGAARATGYLLRVDGPATPPLDGPHLAVTAAGAGFQVRTGRATFAVGPDGFDPSWQVSIAGVALTDPSRSRCELTDQAGATYVPRIQAISLETAGPVRTTVRLDGTFADDARHFCDFIARVSFFAGSATVRVALTLRNPRPARHSQNLWDLGDAGSIYIRDLSVCTALRRTGPRATTWSVEPGSPFVAPSDQDVEIYQDSSGGPNWASANHVNRRNDVTTSFRGYRVRTADAEWMAPRAQPVVALQAGRAGVAGSIRHFWQNFPKAIEVRGHHLVLRLFPEQSVDVHELQGGEQKTHVIDLSFFDDTMDLGAIGRDPSDVVAQVPSDWYAASGAIAYLTPRAADPHHDYLSLVDLAIEGETSFAAKREIVDEFGWRHFGDLYADHEAIHYDGMPPVISHYNNQYDAVYGAFVQFLRSGDARWRAIMEELATHVVDVDIYHTERDRSEYAGGLFWHTNHYASAATATHRTFSRRAGAPGGGPNSGHCYTAGLMHHYFLTGEIASRDAVIGLARWIIAMEDGARSRFWWLDSGPTGCASATHTRSYHGPGRAPANAINTLLDAFALTDERSYLDHAEALLRRCIHPRDDIRARQLLDVERRWSYTMFLQALGRYLDVKIERDELDAMYAYAQASLLAYASWMAEHEVPYLSRPDRIEFPTETWSAQDMRKSDVFKFAAKHASGPARERYLARSASFFRSSVAELAASKTRHLTRPIVIMMTCGYMQAYFEVHPDEAAAQVPAGVDFGAPQPFTSQRDRVLAKIRVLVATGLVAGLASAYRFWWATP